MVVFSPQLSSDGDDYDYDSTPLSPDIGMTREGGSGVQNLDLGKGSKEAADVDLLTLSNTIEKYGANDQGEGRMYILPQKRQVERSLIESVPKVNSGPTAQHLSVPDPTHFSTHRSARAKNTLIYDQKYHPMDDILRPSQAAKRRLLHGEIPALGVGSDDDLPEKSGFDVGSTFCCTDTDDEDLQPPTAGQKRKRPRPQYQEPTRRSLRIRTKPKVSYNMKIHPQDSDLKRAYDCSHSSPSTTHQVGYRTTNADGTKVPPGGSQKVFHTFLSDTSDGYFPEPSLKPSLKSQTQDLSITESVRKQAIQLSKLHPNLHPDAVYLMSNQNPWPDVKGLPFCVYTERIEDQLNAEAEAASSFHYEEDDKENEVTNPELIPSPNPLDGMSIIPASHYRRSPGLPPIPFHSNITSNVISYTPHFEASLYHLSWSDDDLEVNSDTRDCPFPDYMRILASSESLPRTSTLTETRSYRNDTSVSSSPTRNLTGFDLRR